MNAAQIAVDSLKKHGNYVSNYFLGKPLRAEEVQTRVQRFAKVLADHGVSDGDRVVVMMTNSPDVAQAFQAIWRLGAAIVPIMPQLVAAEVQYIVEHSGAKLLITTPDIADRVVDSVQGSPELEGVLTFGSSELESVEDIAPQVEAAEPWENIRDCEKDDLAVLVYTSGTTGHPKGVMLTHGCIISNTQSACSALNWSLETRTLMVLPMSHVYGILLMTLGDQLGATSILLPTFDPQEVLRSIEKYKIQRASLVPTMLVYLVRTPNIDDFDLSSLEVVVAGSAPLSEELRVEFEERFQCRLTDGYGQSEATCAVSAFRDEDEYVVGSAGRPLPGIEVCILDDDNQLVSAGESGEICIRGPGVMKGYWRDEVATREAIVEGWLHSGDIGHMNEEGFIFITDRKKDLIIKGAENISPREIENAIYRNPAVAEVTVFGVADETYQEEVAAAVVLKAGQQATAEDIRDQAAAHITKFKLPKYVTFHDELPKNSNGKILKRVLRDQFVLPEC